MKIGITTTVPIEVLYAAGYQVVDLNNIFISSKDYLRYIEIAERDGFPKSLCAWIKGIYGACIENNIKEVVGVIEGDCSNTKALVEVLKSKGIKIYPFSYPTKHTLDEVKKSIDDFINQFNVSKQEVERVRNKLNIGRKLAKEIDRLTVEFKATGFENHLYQISLSDFNGDVDGFINILKQKVEEIKNRKPKVKKLKLAYIGVPPMTGDLYDFVEGFDAQIIYNEVQREFAFPRFDMVKDIYEQYYYYTYPYSLQYRLEEIKKQLKERDIDGVIHYTQAFCYRAIDDIIIKSQLEVPVLNIEGDKLNCLDARTKIRIEAFLDMLKDLKGD
ncbi:Benzoyl-CoA reductase/2-hydroxyglutaryl-CoA dehydratase subunit, BcrC/BadD/HgdB [Caloramator fervidus]|uniref:Benzoyl-CoA reductase/2-hydroxyglutaryl-CoA dehydratase subunit, BcrC/BadD/HgdB n=1 Tax=Caloramator fervidus TaxID=29344 RepID=A0A1H5WTA0_9CLOT|nr:2-hydroxyacyl-CoA dehydratase [Caloramator fervidus]SEG02525.1 Benzoyl-CoA reductase/2-hydroxyglutaryl-CoA dehydratase subunit, BcrC/BadD/HgdB [Caloramator fervidus]